MTINSQLPDITIQFSQSYEAQKMRRLVDDINQMRRAMRSMLSELTDLQSQVDGATGVADHVLASTVGLGEHHQVTGLTAGQVLKATAADNAAFSNLRFDEMAGIDPATFVSPENLSVLSFVDGYYSMRSLTLGFHTHPEYVEKATLTTLGDMFVRDSGGVTRLPLGASGYVLTATPSGPQYQAPQGRDYPKQLAYSGIV